MFENLLSISLLENPILLALILAIVRNIGGFIEAKLKNTSEKYDPNKLGATIATYETFFIGLSQLPNMPMFATGIITVAVDALRSLKVAVSTPQPATIPVPTGIPENMPTIPSIPATLLSKDLLPLNIEVFVDGQNYPKSEGVGVKAGTYNIMEDPKTEYKTSIVIAFSDYNIHAVRVNSDGKSVFNDFLSSGAIKYI